MLQYLWCSFLLSYYFISQLPNWRRRHRHWGCRSLWQCCSPHWTTSHRWSIADCTRFLRWGSWSRMVLRRCSYRWDRAWWSLACQPRGCICGRPDTGPRDLSSSLVTSPCRWTLSWARRSGWGSLFRLLREWSWSAPDPSQPCTMKMLDANTCYSMRDSYTETEAMMILLIMLRDWCFDWSCFWHNSRIYRRWARSEQSVISNTWAHPSRVYSA